MELLQRRYWQNATNTGEQKAVWTGLRKKSVAVAGGREGRTKGREGDDGWPAYLSGPVRDGEGRRGKGWSASPIIKGIMVFAPNEPCE